MGFIIIINNNTASIWYQLNINNPSKGVMMTADKSSKNRRKENSGLVLL